MLLDVGRYIGVEHRAHISTLGKSGTYLGGAIGEES